MLKSLKHFRLNLSAKFGKNKSSNRQLIEKSICKALSHGVPFAAYTLPGENCPRIVISYKSKNKSVNEASSSTFVITPWDSSEEIILRNQIDVKSFLNEIIEEVELKTLPLQGSTSFMTYSRRVDDLIRKLNETGGKCVISRIESYNFIEGFSPELIASAAMRILCEYKNEFSYIFYHPTLGIWVAASPEKLIYVDYITGNFETIALAGTRQKGEEGAWDNKNIREHKYVSDFVENKLKELGISFEKMSPCTVTAGKIEHIMTPFRGYIAKEDVQSVISVLHPTPAIAGYPVEESLNQIRDIESHERRCYSGIVKLTVSGKLYCYVTLRCAEITPTGIAFYGGGGITGSSDTETEWRESARKISTLMPYFFPTE